MRFPPSLLDEIRARLQVSDVVGRRVKLRRQGREFIGLSPFNQEKSPSFTVNDQKGFYHCFSSGKHGDIFRFVMETEGLSFPEAVERLAGEAGVPMPRPDPRMEEREKARAGLIDVTEAATVFFEAQLTAPAGREARDYLERRGVPVELQRRFRLGYAPGGRTALKDHLVRQGIAVEDMARAGLLVTGSDIPVPFDRMRDRLIFPIPDARGRIIAFGGRALRADQQPKYLNSPETELFHKGRVLFNFAAARRSAHDAGTIVVAEGYMDVIALTAAGIPHAVAPLGTALTEDQLALLWRVADEPVLCFDGDSAGLRAAFRAVDLALPGLQPGKSLRFALMPEGQDPDDLLKSEGAAAVLKVVEQARPLAEMLWTREVEAAPLDTPERRAAFEARLRATVARVGNGDVRRHYEDAVRERLRQFFSRGRGWTPAPRGERRGQGARRRAGAAGEVTPPSQPSRELLRSVSGMPGRLIRGEGILLLALVNHPDLLLERAEAVAELELVSAEQERVRGALLDAAAQGCESAEEVRAFLDRRRLGDALRRIEEAWHASGRPEWWAAADAAPIDVERGWDHTAALHRKMVTLHKQLKAAEVALDTEPSDDNILRLYEIREELASAEGTEALIEGFGQASGRSSRAF